MLGFPLGLIAANAFEWVMHKYVLHDLGRNKKSYWSFHWHEHHKQSRRGGFKDADYERSPWEWNAQGKELYGLLTLSAGMLPLFGVAPWFCTAVWASSYGYYAVHKKSHLDPEWAREHLTWHYDHHMGPNQDANWCVTLPLFDHIMGTRERYAFTEREAKDRRRATIRSAARR